MEAKPIVTCHGDQALFSQLHSLVAQGLPKEECEWRRSYGRPPKTLNLEASFVPYDPDILPGEDDPVLISRPYFHIFWTSCDIELYKQTVKDELSEWQADLKNQNIPDWLIVVVVMDESKVKSKLLPRASVPDKVKSDFCGKNTDRCVVLTEPLKTEQKSVESWNNFFVRLRYLLLQAYSRQMNRFENNMRALREKRNETGWNYHEYFVVQEELAFMLEMLGLWDDALVQYDELDALFAQFVENHAAGALCDWLQPFIRPCTNWTGLSLAKPLDHEMRSLIKQNKASLLEFRDYLFSRQCALVFLLHRPWEVAKRALDYLHFVVQEMLALEVEVPHGALSCWVFLSCLEVLDACESYSDMAQMDKYSLYTASLWDYARKKLKELGSICGLAPGKEPTSEQLSRRVDLASGMVVKETDKEHKKKLSPVDRLRQALSSNESFKKHYLEICELAMGTFKHIGRFRSSRIIGRDLADFYIKMNELQKAETFLQDAIKMYQQEGWSNLAAGTMIELAQCQENMSQPHKYLHTICQISCSPNLKPAVKSKYFNSVHQVLNQKHDEPYILKSSGIFTMETATILTPSVHLNDNLLVDLKITSHFPGEVTCDKISISVLKCEPELTPDSSLFNQKKICHVRSPSLTNGRHEQLANFQPIRKQLPSTIQAKDIYEVRHGKIVAAGVTCANAHELLKRLDSACSSDDSPEVVEKGDYSVCLVAASNKTKLKPGENTVQLRMKCDKEGVFQMSQLCFQLKHVEFLKPISASDLYFRVTCIEPHIYFKPVKADKFLVGIHQEAVFSLTTGSLTLAVGDNFKLEPEAGFDLQVIGDLAQQLPVEANKTVNLSVKVFCPENTDFEEKIEKKLKCVIPSWNKTLETEVVFIFPFAVSQRLHTSVERKYIQLTVQGSTSSNFILTRPELCALTNDVEVYLMNSPGQEMTVSNLQAANYVWQMKCNTPKVTSVEMVFTVDYSSDLDLADVPRRHHYTFSIENFQTKYILNYHIESGHTKKMYKVGKMCTLHIEVKKTHTGQTNHQNLVYEVCTAQQNWAISAKSTGVFTLNNGYYKTIIDVLPLEAGFIHLPMVTLQKYNPESKIPVVVSEELHGDQNLGRAEQEMVLFEPFSVGEVYNGSQTKQVHVKPDQSNHDVEINVQF